MSTATSAAPAALIDTEMKQFRSAGYLGPFALCSPEQMAARRPTIERVLTYDSEDHALQVIHGVDAMGFNRLSPPPA